MNNNMYRHQQPYPLSGYYPPELTPPSMVPMSYTHWHSPIPTYHPTWQPTPMPFPPYQPTPIHHQPIQYPQPRTFQTPRKPTPPCDNTNIPLPNPSRHPIYIFQQYFHQSPIFKFTPVTIWRDKTGAILAFMKKSHAAVLQHTIQDILLQIQAHPKRTPFRPPPHPAASITTLPTHKTQPTQPKPQPPTIQQPLPANPLTSLPLIQPPPHPNLIIWKPKGFRLNRWLKRLKKRGKQPTYITTTELHRRRQKQKAKRATASANTQHQHLSPSTPPATQPPKAITLIELLQDLWKQPTATHKVQPPSLGIQSSVHQSRSHTPFQSRPRSLLTYGLCWHLALLAKAMATAWDLITQTDLWSSQL